MELESKEFKKPGFFSSIRFKLIVWFFLVLFIPLSIGGAALYFYSKSKIEKSTINYLGSIVDSNIENLKTFLNAKKVRLVDFGTDGLIRDKTELIGYYGKVKERMVDLSSHLAKNKTPLDPDILETFVMDLDGEVIASSNPQNILLKKQNTDYFINAKRYGVYASSLHDCMDVNVPVVEISRMLTSIKSEEVKPVGVIVNRIRGSSIVDVAKQGVTVGGKSDKRLNLRIYVLDSNYQILGGSGTSPASHHLSDGKSFKNTINTKLVKMFDKSGENNIGMYENHLGLSVMGTIRHLEDLDLFILIEMDERDAFAALTRVKWSAIIISPVVFMAIIAVAFVLSTRLSRPITVMTDITRKIASGHLKERIPVNRKDEIGLLAASFNNMTFRLEESRKQSLDYALSLEERTKELLVKNQQQEVIVKIGNLLWIELDLQGIMDKVVNLVSRTLNVEFCEMLLLDRSEKFLNLESGVGWKEGIVGHATVDIGLESQAGYTLKEQQPIIIRDLRAETRFSVSLLLKDHGVVSGLSVPMIIGTHALGVIGVHTTQIRDFSNNETNFLQSVGNLMASVIEHKRIEEVLKESEDKFRMISASSQDAIIMLDNDERISYWNDAAEKIFDYSREEVIEEQIHKLIIPEKLREAHLNGFERFKETGQGPIIGKRVEVAAIRKDGREFPIELSLSAVKIKGKWNAIGMIRDVTERIKSEKRLHAQHAVTHILSVSTTFKEASSKILQAICESLYWEFGAMWLYHRQDDVLRCSGLWHVPDIEVSEFKEKTREISFASGIGLPGRVLATCKPAWIVDVVQDSNFPRAPVALKAGLHAAFGFPVIVNNEVLGTLEFFSQKTEEPDNDLLNMMSAIGSQIALFIKRKQMEEELRISHKMSSIGRLSASVFHEILNPVNIIAAHTQLLLMDAAKGSKTEEDLKSIQGEIGRIVNITDNLLKFAKKEETKAEEVEINGLLEDVLSLIKPELNLKSIKPITKFEKDLPNVMAHGSELREVFLKLITNAIEAMPEGGTLIVKTRVVRPPAGRAGSKEFARLPDGQGAQRAEGKISELKGDFVEITFADTGCGIAKENIDRIFEPFFSTKEEIKGVGLGLSSSYAIIESYGGAMSVESEEGKGATFIIDLPC